MSSERRSYGATQCGIDCYQVRKRRTTKEFINRKKTRLAHSLEERVPSGLATIEEWNEVLMCLADAPPESEKKSQRKNFYVFFGVKNTRKKTQKKTKRSDDYLDKSVSKTAHTKQL